MYIVANGYSFTSKRGILGPGNEIAEKDFASHEAFVKAVAKGKIVIGKGREQLEKEAAERAQKQQEAVKKAAEMEKEKTLDAARRKKETAASAVDAAKAALASAEQARDTAREVREKTREAARLAASALIERRVENKELNDAYNTLVKAGDKLKSAQKPAEKTAANNEYVKAKANYDMKENEDAKYKALAAVRDETDAADRKAETENTEAEAKAFNAKEAVTLAEAELEKAGAELAALEGK
ncbi:MAG: hypothetical protein LBP37_04230 [Spirochaetaceae bacterium]|jgi:colicin import membrane protein|nr:hypothetical protein [Spirochaetaceae bacterium]